MTRDGEVAVGPGARLWLTEPARRTCIAVVTHVARGAFTVDRTLFAPRSRTCRHPQAADSGTVWIDGEKRRLSGVRTTDGAVWLSLRGVVPDVGSRLQCHLDADARDANDRAHTAMHLLLAALGASDAPAMTADPEVKGGGHFRLTFASAVSPPMLAEALARTNAWATQDLPVTRTFATRAEADRVATPQRFQPPDPVPGPEVMPLVSIGDVCTHPCDGTHVTRTGRIGRIVIGHARPGKGGFVVVGKAV